MFFLSLLKLLDKRSFDVSSTFDLREITIEMLVMAWYPYTGRQLSLGSQDMIGEQLEALGLGRSELPAMQNISPTILRKRISSYPLN